MPAGVETAGGGGWATAQLLGLVVVWVWVLVPQLVHLINGIARPALWAACCGPGRPGMGLVYAVDAGALGGRVRAAMSSLTRSGVAPTATIPPRDSGTFRRRTFPPVGARPVPALPPPRRARLGTATNSQVMSRTSLRLMP
jgi:hypothetical protein